MFVFFQLAAAHFGFWEVQGISNTPRIISPLGKSHGMVFKLALSCSGVPNLSYFPLISPTFPSFLSKELLMGSVRFWLVFAHFSNFWASWVVLAAAHFGFWEVQGISNTPRIISPLGKSHQMVFNLAHCYSGFPNLSCLSLFLPYSLHFPPKNSRWEAFGFIGFCTLFQLLGELGGSGSCSLWFLRSARHLQYP